MSESLLASPGAATISSPNVTEGKAFLMPDARHSPTLRRRRLSTELRKLREAAGMTSVTATERLGWSSGKLTRMERGEWQRPNPRDVQDLCDLYRVDDQRQRTELMTLAREGKERGWWYPYKDMISEAYSTYIGLEAGAAEIYTWEPQVVPGLLQTAEYARAVLRGGPAEIGSEEIEQRLEIRIARQGLLTRQDPLRLWAVLDESALRREVGGQAIMREQLEHLLNMSDLAKVNLQIVPFSHGAHAGVHGSFSVLDFPDPRDPDAVYVDTPAGELFVEVPEEVSRFQAAFQHLQEAAISTEDTLRMIAETARS